MLASVASVSLVIEWRRNTLAFALAGIAAAAGAARRVGSDTNEPNASSAMLCSQTATRAHAHARERIDIFAEKKKRKK